MPWQSQLVWTLVFGFLAAAYIHPLVGLLVVLIGALLAWAIRKRNPPSATAAALSERLASVRYMSGSQFEHFVADLMCRLGYRTQVLGGSGDQGVDVIAARRGERIAVQCKQHSRPVGNKPVQEVFTGAKHHSCTKAMVVAPMGFTKGAFALARSVGVDLHDRDSLRVWIQQIDRREKDQANERNRANERIPAQDPASPREQASTDKPDSEHHLEQYDDLLESYREHLDVLEEHYSWKANVDAYMALDPALAAKWDNTYNTLTSSIRKRLAAMDLLEIAEAEKLEAEGRIARRAELSARQAEIESI